ncbi:MAG: gliding motility-associated ABC transporter ATP-binding subunit GldA [Flavobacteriales bacterium]|nr:gliding motility-associated ABC transporter ATP-binding subunit GldA [Flavobacteriales bacterium]
MSIITHNVSKLYGTQRALSHVSFSIDKGEVVGFLGPNGAGKSTMMKIITCFIPQTEGTVKVCGFDTQEQSIEVRRRIGYLPEHNPLYTDMYVREYLTFTGELYKIPNLKKRVGEMIEMVGLTGEAHKKIEALSKGYRQRVGLAQAMIHNPEVLILDEPTSGLDPNQLAEIRELIKQIGKEKTVMLSTHIMQEVEAICSRVIIINKGEIVADDAVENMSSLLSKGQQRIRVEFSAAISSSSLAKIPGLLDVANSGANMWLVNADGSGDVRQSIFDFAVKENIAVLSLQKEEVSLEEVFKALTT